MAEDENKDLNASNNNESVNQITEVSNSEIEDPAENPNKYFSSLMMNPKVYAFLISLLVLIGLFIAYSTVHQPEKKSAIDDDNNKAKFDKRFNGKVENLLDKAGTGLALSKEKPKDDKNTPLAMPTKNGMATNKKEEKTVVVQRIPQLEKPKSINTPPKTEDVNDALIKQELSQIRQMRIDNFKSAVTSTTKVSNFTGLTSSTTTTTTTQEYNYQNPNQPNGMTNYDNKVAQEKAYVAQLRNQQNNSNFGDKMTQMQIRNAVNSAEGGNSNGSNNQMQITKSSSIDPTRWDLGTSVRIPEKYSILTGTVIHATTLSGINTDIAGKITAQVSQNVYDTATGKHLMIPQGTRILGSYGSNVIYGQERVLVGWERLIFPDGKSIDIGNMEGSDQSGYSGFKDEVNNHYLRLFGSSFMLSVISAGVAWSADRTSNNNDSTSFSNELASSSGSQLGNTSSELIRKNMNIAPTLTVRTGYRLNVIITKDIVFNKAYQNFDYNN